ncbi:MAG: preprotein translocase subunit SecG [Firmicutes bacterium HGW-Firmicutes-15]|nr:MAG: preprotein translocase subunit SecG [Firmicutes bacterium HGW-Firmicutes-15]
MVKIIFLVLQVICALGLIFTVLMQEGKSAGLSGSIAGGADMIFGKKKGVDELFAKITAYLAAFFLLFTLLVAMLNA